MSEELKCTTKSCAVVKKDNKMSFNVKCVKEFLEEKGFVFTVRDYKLKHKKVSVDNIGYCVRTFIKEIKNPEDLTDYAKNSGFENGYIPGSYYWWDIIQKMYKDKPKYLYLVTKIPDEKPKRIS